MSERAGFSVRGDRGLRALVAAVLACLALPPAALGHDPAPTDGRVPAAVESALGGEVTELPNGLYAVDPARGPGFTSHGPDTAADVAADHGEGLGPGDPERPPACASGGYYQHVLYAYRSGSPNRIDEVKAGIQASIRRINAVLSLESLASGGGTADYRVLCDESGGVRVDAFSTPPNATSLSSVTNAARSAGFDDPDVDYTIFFDYDSPQYCGVGHYASDESLAANNVNNRGGDYGMTYDGCWNGSTPMHENGHNQGAVQYDAPYSTGDGAHCWDENDVMCYADGGNLYPGSLLDRCTDRLYFDCGFDSYFDAAPESCEYLASHWNMGSRLNRFIEFGGPDDSVPPECSEPPTGQPPAPAPAPTPAPTPTQATQPAGGGAAPGAVNAPAQRLTNRDALSDVSAAAGGWRFYDFRVPRGSSRLIVKLDCAPSCSDHLDLYARAGGDVSQDAHDCRSAGAGSDERCRIRAPRRGIWSIGVRTASGAGGSEYEISARYRR